MKNRAAALPKWMSPLKNWIMKYPHLSHQIAYNIGKIEQFISRWK